MVPTLLQTENAFQLIIKKIICAPISQNNDRLGCKPRLIVHFHTNLHHTLQPP